MSESDLKNNEKTEKNGMERGLQNRHVQIIASAVVTVWNYLSRKKWIF